MSILPLSALCGGAAALSSQYGAGRAAAQSTAFHAREAQVAGWQDLMARLSELEREEVESWKSPVPVVMGSAVLDYAAAEKEVEVGLDEMGFYAEAAEAMTVGHLDFAWNHEGIAYVVDIKRQVHTTPEGPESLQLHAYGRAYALKMGCHSYCTALWLATEGEWLWSKEVVQIASPRGEQLFQRIRAAAMSGGEYSTGEHCRHCYARLHCPEWALPAALAGTYLAPVAGGNLPTDPQKAGELVLIIQHAEETLDRAKKNLQEAVRRGALRVIDPTSGKVWRPVEMPGRKSLDAKGLRAELGDEKVDSFMRQGADYTQFRWSKAE